MSETRPARCWPIMVIRILAVVVLLQVLIQAALAGGFITGDVGLLGLHTANAILLVLTSAALLPATILLVRPGRGPWWPIVVSVALWWAIVFQVGLGFARLVGLHIPVGMSIMGLIAAFTWWAFSYRPGRHPSAPPTSALSTTAAPMMAPAPDSASPAGPVPVATGEALPRRQP